MGVNKEILSSTLNVTYTTSGGEIEMNNFTYSIQNQNFTLAQLEDGAIRVDYAIGKIEKTFLLPTAITVDRYKAFTDKMSKKNKKQVSSNYTLYEPESLDKKDTKDEIIAKYPSVTEQALYVLKADTTATNKGKIEGYFVEAYLLFLFHVCLCYFGFFITIHYFLGSYRLCGRLFSSFERLRLRVRSVAAIDV